MEDIAGDGGDWQGARIGGVKMGKGLLGTHLVFLLEGNFFRRGCEILAVGSKGGVAN